LQGIGSPGVCPPFHEANGPSILADAVVSAGSEYDFAKWVDLLMLVLLAGKERTEEEFRSLLAGGGFTLKEVIETGCQLKLLVASPIL
jgi:hypothetical protein